MKIKSLFLRIILILLILIVLVNVISLTAIIRNIEKRTSERLVDDALLVLHSLDWAFTPLLEKNENENIQRLVENVGSSELIKTLKIVNNNNEVLYSNLDFILEDEESEIVYEIFQNKKLQYDTRFENNEIVVSVPIRGKNFSIDQGNDIQAALLLRVDNRFKQKNIREVYLSYAIMMIITTVLFISMISIVLFIFVDKPLRKFKNSIRYVVNRDYSHRIHIKHKGEFEELAKVYNLMLEKVSKHTDELNEARDLAETSDVSKSQFLAKVSHELLTPINTIIGFNELLIEIESNDQKLNKMNVISHSSKTLLQLVKDLLDLSEYELEKVSVENLSFNVKEVISNIYKSRHKEAEIKNLKMEWLIDDSLPDYLCGDSKHLIQLLSNLIDNAIKFTKSGYVKLSASYTGKILEIRVIDSGIGIKDSKIDTIFETFNQQDNSLSRSFSGSGLGLALCKRIVNIMNGSIEVTSRLHEGTTFTVKLPMSRVDVGAVGNENVSVEKEYSSFLKRMINIINEMDEAIARNDSSKVKDYLLIIKSNSEKLELQDFYNLSFEMLKSEEINDSLLMMYSQLKKLITINISKKNENIFRVLFVDSSIEVKSLANHFNSEYDVDISESTLEALQSIFIKHYDVIIINVSLLEPGDDFFEVMTLSENKFYVIGIINQDTPVSESIYTNLDWFVSTPLNPYLIETKLDDLKTGKE